jgi:protein transport protein YIF1
MAQFYPQNPQSYAAHHQHPAGGPPPPPVSSHHQGLSNNAGQGGDFSGVFKSFPQHVSPEMINFGLSAGQDILNKQRDRWMPGAATFWGLLKIYFAVNNKFVLKKLSILLYPIQNKHWARLTADDVGGGMGVGSGQIGQDSVQSRKWAIPKHDTNAPDLYIPLMAFVTYVLLYGLWQGLVHERGFSPEVLIKATWGCVLVQIVEVCIIKFGLSLLSAPIHWLDIVAYTGYKYVGLSVSVLARAFGSTFTFLSSVYTALMLAYFVLKTMASAVPVQSPLQSSGPPRHLVLLAFALLQCMVALYLGWL